MTNIPKIILKKRKEEPLKRFHRWVFSGAVDKTIGKPEEGDIVDVYSNSNEYLGCGHYANESIVVRMLSFEKTEIDNNFWINAIAKAYSYRLALNIFDKTNAFRLVNGEADCLPGLIVDYYNGTCVIQCHTVGMYNSRNDITEALVKVLGDKLSSVYDKSIESLPKKYTAEANNSLLMGNTTETIITENGVKFTVNFAEGQKTGFYLDQRENRNLLNDYCKNRTVLNTFCYSGGFSLYALKAGANKVVSVDSSKKAIEMLERNIEVNNFQNTEHTSHTADVLDYIKNIDQKFDLIILDPPAFAKHISAKNKATMGYRRLNAAAMKQIKSGGILFTFSCSQVIDRNLFKSVVHSAAIDSGRNIRIVNQLTQPNDHPINIFHPESEYLKGLIVYVE